MVRVAAPGFNFNPQFRCAESINVSTIFESTQPSKSRSGLGERGEQKGHFVSTQVRKGGRVYSKASERRDEFVNL